MKTQNNYMIWTEQLVKFIYYKCYIHSVFANTASCYVDQHNLQTNNKKCPLCEIVAMTPTNSPFLFFYRVRGTSENQRARKGTMRSDEHIILTKKIVHTLTKINTRFSNIISQFSCQFYFDLRSCKLLKIHWVTKGRFLDALRYPITIHIFRRMISIPK